MKKKLLATLLATLMIVGAFVSTMIVSVSAETEADVLAKVYTLTKDNYGLDADDLFRPVGVNPFKTDATEIAEAIISTDEMWGGIWPMGGLYYHAAGQGELQMFHSSVPDALYMIPVGAQHPGVSFTAPYTGTISVKVSGWKEIANSATEVRMCLSVNGSVYGDNRTEPLGGDKASAVSATFTAEVKEGDVLTVVCALPNGGDSGNAFLNASLRYTAVPGLAGADTDAGTAAPDTGADKDSYVLTKDNYGLDAGATFRPVGVTPSSTEIKEAIISTDEMWGGIWPMGGLYYHVAGQGELQMFHSSVPDALYMIPLGTQHPGVSFTAPKDGKVEVDVSAWKESSNGTEVRICLSVNGAAYGDNRTEPLTNDKANAVSDTFTLNVKKGDVLTIVCALPAGGDGGNTFLNAAVNYVKASSSTSDAFVAVVVTMALAGIAVVVSKKKAH